MRHWSLKKNVDKRYQGWLFKRYCLSADLHSSREQRAGEGEHGRLQQDGERSTHMRG
jgi:hypothetical protein